MKQCSIKLKHETFVKILLNFERLAYMLSAYCYGSNSDVSSKRYLYGTKYRVRQIVHKTTWTDINSRTLQAAVIIKIFRNLKSTRNKNNKFLKYKISICLDHTYMYIVLRVSYTCNFIDIDSILKSINCQGNQMLTTLQY